MKLFLVSFFLTTWAAGFTLAACPVDVDHSLKFVTTTQGINPEQLNFYQQLWSAHKDFANQVWILFQSGEKIGEQIESCVRPPLTQKNLNFAINEIFFRHSVEGMRLINPAVFDRLSKRQKISELAFSVLNRCEACLRSYDKLDQQRSAHFNHSTQAILADVARLSAADWKIIFIHEVGHYFFPDKQWSDLFLDGKRMIEIEKIVKDKVSVEKLSDQDRKMIDEWLMNGIRTKLIAEWRVWSFTLDYIIDHKDIELGIQTAWLRRYHQLPRAEKDIELFKALENNFEQPTEGLEAHPIILDRLVRLRKKLIEQVQSQELKPDFNID